MKTVLGIILIVTWARASPNLDNFIEEINSKQNHWRAGKNFNGVSLSRLHGLTGTKKLPEDVLKTIPVMTHDIDESDIPESFDAREKWPMCESIGKVRDQSSCDSDWVS